MEHHEKDDTSHLMGKVAHGHLGAERKIDKSRGP